MDVRKTVAIVLAAGSGKRMQSDTAKQYLLMKGKPILYYTLKEFENSAVDEVILVVGKDEIDFCRKTIVMPYQFKKVTQIVKGGNERYHSVYNGLKSIMKTDYVLIHDGARPFISVDIINNMISELKQHGACVVGVPAKDTVKIVGENGFVEKTPDRNRMWMVQTPQAFHYDIIFKAYSMIMKNLSYNSGQGITITDDAMVVEHTLHHPIKMVMGSYRNIKITTPEDLLIGEVLLEENMLK